MIVCPKCNVSNDDIYSFCVECGTTLSKTSIVSSEAPPTALFTPDQLPPDKTLLMPPDKLPPTVRNSNQQSPPQTHIPQESVEPPPTALFTPDKLPPTQHYSQTSSVEKEVPPTQFYSPPNTDKNDPPPTVQMSPDKLPPTVQRSNQSLSTAQQFVPPESIETAVSPQFKSENFNPKPDTKQKPEKSKKIFMVGGISLLLLLVGGVAAAYFLHQPRQANKSYLLADKHDADKVLNFDNQSKEFLMVSTDENASQKWQITPDPDNKNYYRFVNRGVGEGESLEVVDNNQDSSVKMAGSANDVGQLWAITNVEGDYYRITNQWLGDAKSLSHNKRNYYFLRLKDSSNEEGQLWKEMPAKNGQDVYLVNKQYGDAVALQALEGEYKDKLVMKSDDLGNRQWKLTDAGNGYYNFSTAGSGKSLDASSDKKDRVVMSASNSSSGQKWKKIPVGNYFRLTNESLGDGKSLEAVTFVKYYIEMTKSSDNDPGQLWKIENLKK